MSAFNPWHGFPSKNAVYLDRNFDLMRGSGQAAYGTFQTAYVYAAALAVSTGETVFIYVGEGTAAQFGGLTLSAAYNSSVVLVGLTKDLSKLGAIAASNADGDGYAVDMKIANITIGAITSNGIVISTTGNGGAITIVGNGFESCEVGAIQAMGDVNNPTNGGAVTLSYLTYGSVNSAGPGTAGSITVTWTKTSGLTTNRIAAGGDTMAPITGTDAILGACSMGGQLVIVPSLFTFTRCRGTTIDGSSSNNQACSATLVDSDFTSINISGNGSPTASLTRSHLSGAITATGDDSRSVTLDKQSSCGNIDTSNSSLATVNILNGSLCGSLTFFGPNMSLTVSDSETGPVLNSGVDGDTAISIINSLVTATGTNNCIQLVRSGGFNVDGSRLVTVGGNAATIGNFIDTSGTAQIKNSSLIQNGSGIPLGGAGGSTIILANVVTKAPFNDSLFVVIGQWISNPSFL